MKLPFTKTNHHLQTHVKRINKNTKIIFICNRFKYIKTKKIYYFSDLLFMNTKNSGRAHIMNVSIPVTNVTNDCSR